MFVIEVIPLIKGIKIDTLSYYSSLPYAVGTFVRVPVRNKLTPALVVEIHNVTDNRTTLRQATFSLKKLPAQKETYAVPENLLHTAEALTKIYPTGLGAILYQLLPPEVRNGKYKYPNISTLKHNEETIPRVLTGRRSSRYINYRAHIRSVLARRGSVLLVVPTSVDTQLAYDELSLGITDRVVVFSPTATEKDLRTAYQAFDDTSLAKLIITTPSHAYLDRVDLLSTIIDNEASEFYQGKQRPYLDHKTALTTHAKITGRSLILGDILPETATEYLRQQDLYSTEDTEIKRLNFSAPFTVIEQNNKPKPDQPFSLFSPDLTYRLKNTLSSRGKVFLYSARRGLSPVVTCLDCGYIFRCPDSGTPYSLIRRYDKTGNEERWFVCSTSGKRVRASDTCAQCSSWRLRERGIGIQTVYDECLEQFPKQKVFLFDKETITNQKRALAVLEEFYQEKSAILVGTQMVLPYLINKGIDLSVVISLDATRSNPTWQADERTLRLLLQLRDFSRKEVMVQTRTPIDNLLQIAKNGQIESFYTEELNLRSSLLYPPFCTFILLSWQGTADFTHKTELEIKKLTTNFAASFYNNPLSTGEKTLRHALFKITKKEEGFQTLFSSIKQLPPYIKVEIDPSRIV